MNAYVTLALLLLAFSNAFGYVVNRHDSDNALEVRVDRNKLSHSPPIKSMRRQRPRRDAMDKLIYEVVADGEKDAIEAEYDKSNDKAETISHRLNERIEHVNLVLTHLEDIAKHFKSVHKMANSLVESEATANFVKKFAIEQLNDSVNKIEKCDSCWER